MGDDNDEDVAKLKIKLMKLVDENMRKFNELSEDRQENLRFASTICQMRLKEGEVSEKTRLMVAVAYFETYSDEPLKLVLGALSFLKEFDYLFFENMKFTYIPMDDATFP